MTDTDFHFEASTTGNTVCAVCGISSFSHSHPRGSKPKDFIKMTEGEVESYAVENIEAERYRVHTILSRVLKSGDMITQEMLDKVILGNRK